MLDHHDTRAWADHGQAFGAWVRCLPAQAREAFEALARIQYAAPWQAREAAGRSASCPTHSTCELTMR